MSRYLVQHFGPDRVSVADIFSAAVDFQRAAFGVHGFVSTTDPTRLVINEKFDCVLVSSLFSHLPRESFPAWLARLYELLTPGGLLLFSVQDSSLLPPTEQGKDFIYRPTSEMPELLSSDYGASWVSEQYVRRAVREVTANDESVQCFRLPRALWCYQDLYVVCRGASGAPPAFSYEPLGYLESGARLSAARVLRLQGWAIDPNGPGPAAVRIRLDDRLVGHCSVAGARPDVVAQLGVAADCRPGWECVIDNNAPIPGQALLTITLESQSGAEFLIHLGEVAATELYLRLRRDPARAAAVAGASLLEDDRVLRQAQIAELERQLSHVEASRFWKARNAWWRWRARLGLKS